MAGLRRLRRSIRCHLKHGTRCPHIERHTIHRPRRRKAAELPPVETEVVGRHAAPGR